MHIIHTLVVAMVRLRSYDGVQYNMVQTMTNNIHLFLKVYHSLCFVMEFICTGISQNNVVS